MYDDPSTSVAHLFFQLRSSRGEERYSAAIGLGRIYATENCRDPSFATVASHIKTQNDMTADVGAPFISQFKGRIPDLDGFWSKKTGREFHDWLGDMLVGQPEVPDEFAAYGLVDTARDYLRDKPQQARTIARRILKAGRPWRAFLVATSNSEPSDDDKQLMEEMALLDNLAVASRATHCLAYEYQLMHLAPLI